MIKKYKAVVAHGKNSFTTHNITVDDTKQQTIQGRLNKLLDPKYNDWAVVAFMDEFGTRMPKYENACNEVIDEYQSYVRVREKVKASIRSAKGCEH